MDKIVLFSIFRWEIPTFKVLLSMYITILTLYLCSNIGPIWSDSRNIFTSVSVYIICSGFSCLKNKSFASTLINQKYSHLLP